MNSDWWCTPRIVADPLAEFFGGMVGTDPCSNAHSIIKAEVALTSGGLVWPWGTRRRKSAYKNPPYSNPMPWARKGLSEIELGHINELVDLVQVATSTEWWRVQCGVHEQATRSAPNPNIIFTKRLKFIGDKDFGARFDTALVYYGKRHAAFRKAFKHITKWTTWGRS